MWSGTINPERWCLKKEFNNKNENQYKKPQRYWQYSLQFIDYNSNYDGDWWLLLWDEDW
jgi:hypothetical protein